MGSTAIHLVTGHVTQPNFGPKISSKGLNNGMLICKLPLIIVIVASRKVV